MMVYRTSAGEEMQCVFRRKRHDHHKTKTEACCGGGSRTRFRSLWGSPENHSQPSRD